VAELVGAEAPIRIRIVGRTNYPDGLAFRAEIARRGLESVFELSPGEVRHPAYFGLIAGSNFLMPLIDGTNASMRAYFESKATASIYLGIGLGVPLVIQRDLASAYGVETGGVTYADGGLVGAMRAAMASTNAQRNQWRMALAATQQELLGVSRENLRQAIAAVRA
jgi:hypothetical protein